MTELLVGTKKGLFALEGEPGAEFETRSRAFRSAMSTIRPRRASASAT